MSSTPSERSQTNPIQAIQKGLVVSCQAPKASPLHHPDMIAAIAHAAVLQGAVGVRIDTPEHVKAVRQLVAVPIIGLWKQEFPHSEVYITPNAEHAQAIAQAGADIIAIDATARVRPNGESMADLVRYIHDELHKPVMADIDTLENAIAAAAAGADVIGTTLYGYTAETRHQTPPGFDLLPKMVKQLEVPIICEGGISSPAMAKESLTLGADAVVVGTAITGIDLLVQHYVGELSTQR
ncbi:MAG: N-acetylmannosamine-6-phosphate 2-epimerase, partial [Okeania sp. SIO2H7]|nr:N-acetylmannosamine-6-phosphate 2-epimerase [Okeania sp. SIO2H7]